MNAIDLVGLLRDQLVSIPSETIMLFGVALLMSGRGFYQTVHFISTGYGFSIAGMALLSMFIFRQNLAWYSLPAFNITSCLWAEIGYLSCAA